MSTNTKSPFVLTAAMKQCVIARALVSIERRETAIQARTEGCRHVRAMFEIARLTPSETAEVHTLTDATRANASMFEAAAPNTVKTAPAPFAFRPVMAPHPRVIISPAVAAPINVGDITQRMPTATPPGMIVDEDEPPTLRMSNAQRIDRLEVMFVLFVTFVCKFLGIEEKEVAKYIRLPFSPKPRRLFPNGTGAENFSAGLKCANYPQLKRAA